MNKGKCIDPLKKRYHEKNLFRKFIVFNFLMLTQGFAYATLDHPRLADRKRLS